MSDLTKAIQLLRDTFKKYAGDDNTLTKKEVSELLHKELPLPKSAEVDTFFQMLDGDGDGVVDFKEYASFVATLSVYLKI